MLVALQSLNAISRKSPLAQTSVEGAMLSSLTDPKIPKQVTVIRSRFLAPSLVENPLYRGSVLWR